MNSISCYWLIGGLFLIHNLEEAATLPSFLAKAGTLASPISIDHWVRFPSYLQFLFAVTLITGLSWIALFGLSRLRNKQLADMVAASIQASIGLNGIWHLGTVMLLKTYVPGSITGVVVNLPFTLVAYRYLLNPYRPTIKHWATVVGLAILWHGPLLWLVLWLSMATVT